MNRWIRSAELPRGLQLWPAVKHPNRIVLPTLDELRSFLFPSNGNRLVCISGPTQSGKTGLIVNLSLLGMLRRVTTDWNTAQHLGRWSFYINGSRLLRALKGFGEDLEYARTALFESKVLYIDDLDKLESNMFGLLREVIVTRDDNGLTTLVSLTDATSLGSLDPQVRRRIEDAKQIILENKPKALRLDNSPESTRASTVRAGTANLQPS